MPTLTEYRAALAAAKACGCSDDALNDIATNTWLALSDADRDAYLDERDAKRTQEERDARAAEEAAAAERDRPPMEMVIEDTEEV